MVVPVAASPVLAAALASAGCTSASGACASAPSVPAASSGRSEPSAAFPATVPAIVPAGPSSAQASGTIEDMRANAAQGKRPGPPNPQEASPNLGLSLVSKAGISRAQACPSVPLITAPPHSFLSLNCCKTIAVIPAQMPSPRYPRTQKEPGAHPRLLHEQALHGRLSARTAPYFPARTSSSAISRSLNFCTFMEGVMGKSSTKNTRLGTLYRAMRGMAHSRTSSSVRSS